MEDLTYFQEISSTTEKQLEELIKKRKKFMEKVRNDHEKIVGALNKEFDDKENNGDDETMDIIADRIRWINEFKNRYMKKARNDIVFYNNLIRHMDGIYAPAEKKQRVRELHNEGLRY